MTQAQQIYRETPASEFGAKYATWPRPLIDEMNAIHQIVILDVQRDYYTKRPNHFWIKALYKHVKHVNAE